MKNRGQKSGALRLCFIILLFSPIISFTQSNFSEIYDSDEYLKTGLELFENGKFDEAVAQYNKITPTDINFLTAEYEKGYALYSAQKYEELEAILKKYKESGEINSIPEMYIIYGNLLSVLDRFEESEQIYLEGKQFIPNSNGLLYNMVIMYIRSEQLQKAVDTLKELVDLNPNNAMAHYLLGLLAFEDGQVVQASLGFLGYLTIDPHGKHSRDAILKMNTKFGEVAKRNPVLIFSEKGDDFSELELILKNELALSSKYNLKSTVDDVYTRQVQVIMEYIPTHKSGGGFFETYYLPWLKEIAHKNYTEHFIYYTLNSFEESIGKPLSSQKKKVETFTQDYLYKSFWHTYAKRNRMHFGKQEDVIVFLQNGLPYSQGKFINGKNEGKFRYVNDQGQMISEINYLDNELDGLQHYYYPNLQKSDEINYVKGIKNGPYKEFHWNGALRLEGNYQNDQNHGAHKSYYPNGGVLCEFSFSQGLEDGKYICYWPNGTKLSEHMYVNNKLEGAGINYNEVGDKVSEYNYSNGLANGKAYTYFDGKQLKSVIDYKDGNESNDSKEYYENNQLKKETIYKNGTLNVYNYYNLSGKLINQTLYDEKGKIMENRYFDNTDSPYFTEYYKNEKINKLVLYHPDENSPNEFNLKNDRIEIKNNQGILVAKGTYKNNELDGEWTYYFPNGDISYKTTYEKGIANGLQSDYHKGNVLNWMEHLNENKSHGLYESYKHGKPYLRVYSYEGENHGPYQYLFPNGNKSSEGFFTYGKKNYNYFDYSIDGGLKSKVVYVNNQVVSEIYYDRNGNKDFEFDYAHKTGNFEIKNSQGQTVCKMELKNGVKNGLTVWYQPDGTKLSEVEYVNNVFHGSYKSYFPNGNISTDGNYYAGTAHGKFNFYDQFGNLRTSTQYLFGKEYGEVKAYYPNGAISHTYNMLDDVEHGEKIYYNYSGKAVASITFALGVPVSYKVLGANGELGESQTIPFGTTQIESTYPNGQMAFTINYVKDLRQGKSELYEENGQAVYKINYKNDKIDGERLQFHTNGKTYRKESFSDGDYQGLVEIFDTFGNPYISIEYYYDIIHGKVKIYKDGKLQQTKTYDTGNVVEIL